MRYEEIREIQKALRLKGVETTIGKVVAYDGWTLGLFNAAGFLLDIKPVTNKAMMRLR
jgi:hypothetical protein